MTKTPIFPMQQLFLLRTESPLCRWEHSGRTEGLTDRKTYRQRDGETSTDRQAETDMKGTRRDGKADRHGHIQTDGHRQTDDGQTDRDGHGRTERHRRANTDRYGKTRTRTDRLTRGRTGTDRGIDADRR
ncbi:hypothetical protein V3C99_000357 [Haemonchus contortus]